MHKPVLIIGATSGIARGIARALAAKGHDLFICGRNTDELKRIARDLELRYRVCTEVSQFDGDDNSSHQKFLNKVLTKSENQLEGVVFAMGDMGDQKESEQDPVAACQIIQRNFTAAVSLLGICANFMGAQKRGFIIGISSVAGDRGRQSNYIYGAAKSGLSAFLEGLRNRMQSSKVRILTVKPGFVDTGMTFGLPGLFLVADPYEAGEKIVSALAGSRDVIYLPWFWRFIMLIIRHIPEPVFKRLKL